MIKFSKIKITKLIKYFFPVLIVILLLQFSDSFCTNLYYEIQSLFIIDFLIDGRGLDSDFATSYLNLAMLPFYIITSLAPAMRGLVDKWGKKLVIIINLGVLIIGCTICMQAENLFIFLLGNAIVTFSCAMDIQSIYIVDEIPYRYHGTIYGCTSGVTAGAAMLIPVLRNLFIDTCHCTWRSLYASGIGITMGVLVILLLLLSKKKNAVSPSRINALHPDNTVTSWHFKEMLLFIRNNKTVHRSILLILLLGIATAGISLYNEPLISFSIANESKINQILVIVPVVQLTITILSGILSDHFGRSTMIMTNLFLSGTSLLTFVITLHVGCSLIILGIAWGIMSGSYYSSLDQMHLIIMEAVPRQNRGKLSALATYAYGIGDAIGMLSSGLLALFIPMGITKLFLTIPLFVIVGILLILSKPSA